MHHMNQISNTNNESLRMAVVSDIHLGHSRNKADRIIRNLDKYLSNDKFLSTIDILFIAGDVYDQLLNLDSVEAEQIYTWEARLLRKCYRHNVCVRVLKGTPSHDRDQSTLFEVVNDANQKSGKMAADLKYVDTLSIEYISRFGINVLYVPDEWGPTNEDTLDQVKVLLKQNNLSKVDFAIMHGLFSYQLPSHIPHIPRHSEEEYEKIVKHLIFIGHIHTHSTKGKIIAQGSFDRLSHNEEEAKGFIRATVNLIDETYLAEFIENKGAAIYTTISCDDVDVTENLLKIDSRLKKIPPPADIRIEAHYTNAILSNMSVIKERWPDYTWSSIGRGKDTKESDVVLDHKNIYIPITLDRQNLKRVLMDRINPMNIDPVIMNICNTHLSELTGH